MKPQYSADKPSDCRYCYYWENAKKECSLGKANCYYQILPTPKPTSDCDGCPYGRAQPCSGWCTKKILHEVIGKE